MQQDLRKLIDIYFSNGNVLNKQMVNFCKFHEVNLVYRNIRNIKKLNFSLKRILIEVMLNFYYILNNFPLQLSN